MPRYIDAEEFIEDIKAENTNSIMNGLKGTPRQLALSAKDVIERINEIQTADVQETRHGRWKEEIDYMTCSACYKDVCRYGDDVLSQEFLFCPHCGARMDGEQR